MTSPGDGPRAAGPWRIRMSGARGEEFVAEVLPALEELGERPAVRVAKSNRVRSVYRVPRPDGALFVKRYHVVSHYERVKYCFVPSRAFAEWRAARSMAAAGLPVPEAHAAGEIRRAGVLRDAFLAVEEIPGAVELTAWLGSTGEEPENRGVRRRVLADLAALVRRMHDAGFSHGDLHGGNILLAGPAERPRLSIIDLHTVRGARRVGPRRRRANLAKLLHSLRTVTNGPDRLRLLADYEGDRPILGAPRRVAEDVFRRIGALERRRLLSRSKRCLRTTTSFVKERIGRYQVFRRREVPRDGVMLAVGDHLQTVERGGPAVLKASRRIAITRQVLAGPVGAGRIVVKEDRPAGPLGRLKNLCRRPRGRAGWVNGNALIVRAASVAPPLALVETGPRGSGPSFLLMADLSSLLRLDLAVLHRFAGPLDEARRREKLRLVRAFARFVRDLHRRGIYHGDFKAVNVYVDLAGEGEPRFFLIDYDRVRFGRRVSERRRVKNLAQIAASVAVIVTKTDRLRFFREWAPDEEARGREKRYNRRVERALRKKIVVRMAPIE